jgi:hypothetical protein
VTATAVEVAPPEPTVAGPDEVLLIPLPGEVETKIRRLAGQSQVPLAAVVASWLAAGDVDAPVPREVAGAVNVLLPGLIVAQVRAEAKRRGLTPGQVAAARLASVAERG